MECEVERREKVKRGVVENFPFLKCALFFVDNKKWQMCPVFRGQSEYDLDKKKVLSIKIKMFSTN